MPLKCRACALLFLWLGVIVTVFLVCTIQLYVDSPPFFAFSLYTYVLMTCAITLDLCYYALAVCVLSSSGLLKLRLLSLGWVSSETILFLLNRVPLSLIFYPVLPLKGWQLLYILFTHSSLTIASPLS